VKDGALPRFGLPQRFLGLSSPVPMDQQAANQRELRGKDE
jgi:hypothetical protein